MSKNKKGEKGNFPQLNKTETLKRIFWLYSLAFLFGYFLRGNLTSFDLRYDKWILVLVVIIALIVLVILAFLFRPIHNLKVQKIRNQYSWVYFLYFGIILSPFMAIFWRKEWQDISSLPWLLVSVLILLAGYKLYNHIEPHDTDWNKFAPGSVGVKNDELDFTLSAKNVSNSLLKLKDYVSVISLYGSLGSGKSSYTRMIVENLNKNHILYTYISLTETNTAKDFSILFSERWFETLSSRYPKIDSRGNLALMKTILRESGNGILSQILFAISTFFSKIPFGILPTKSVVRDSYFDSNSKYVSSDVANIFGNVSEFKEKLWVIVIDEIERAKLDEIFRVIEIVERFKSEGRSGLPIKIVFILCIARRELDGLVESVKNSDVAFQIRKFFTEDPKAITNQLFMPPINYETKENFIGKLAEMLRQNIKLKDDLKSLKPDFPLRLVKPAEKFLLEHQRGYDFISNILILEETPRVILRTISTLEHFYNAFKTLAGEDNLGQIRFSDLLSLSYVKVKYPFLIEFLTDSLNETLPQNEKQEITRLLDKDDQRNTQAKEGDLGLARKAADKTGAKLLDKDIARIEDFIGILSYPHIENVHGRPEVKNKLDYAGTLSWAENLNDALKLIADYTKTPYTESHQIYVKHQRDEDYVKNLDLKALFEYSRFLRQYVANANYKLHKSVASVISEKMISGEIKIQPKITEDTILTSAAYELVFHVMEIVLNQRGNGEVLDEAVDILDRILRSDNIPTGIKFMILNSFANDTRGGGSLIHAQLRDAFEAMRNRNDNKIKDMIKHVFEEAETRFFIKNRKVIYRGEENFFYTMYQYWSGKADDEEDIENIRKVAKHGLRRHPDALKLYWRRYSAGENWKGIDDVLKNDVFFVTNEKNSRVYMPLEDLVSITKDSKTQDPEILNKLKFWNNISKSNQYKDEIAKIGDDPTTLRAILLEKDLLNINHDQTS